MSKFDKRAKELLDRAQSLMDAFELRKGTSGWPDYYEASREIKLQYPDLLIDVQTLLFCDLLSIHSTFKPKSCKTRKSWLPIAF